MLSPLVDAFVADPARDAADYAGLLSLLDRTELPHLVKKLIQAAERSADDDTRSVARDWRRGRR